MVNKTKFKFICTVLVTSCIFSNSIVFATSELQVEESSEEQVVDATVESNPIANTEIMKQNRIENNAQPIEEVTSIAALTIDSTGGISAYNPAKNPLGTKVVIPRSIIRSSGEELLLTKIYDQVFYNEGITEVVFPDTIQTIGREAFRNNNLTSITFPSSVTTVDAQAFMNNEFVSLTIPSGNTTFWNGAFEGNKQLQNVVIEDGITELKESMFKNCSSLSSVKLSNTLEKIGMEAFFGTAINYITLPETLKTISDNAFYKSKLKEIVFPNNVTNIDSNAFSYNQLEKVLLPAKLEAIGQLAFAFNYNIQEIEIPASCKIINSRAFWYAGLKRVKLHEGLEEIGDTAFSNNALIFLEIPNSLSTLSSTAFTGTQKGGEGFYIKDGDRYSYQFPADMDYRKVSLTTSGVTYDKSTGIVTSATPFTKIQYTYTVANNTESAVMDVEMKLSVLVCHVTLKDFDGTTLLDGDVNGGEDIADTYTIPTPTRAGYTFIGWDLPLTKVLQSLEITAQYKQLPTYTAENTKIKKGAAFNPKSYIEARDADNQLIDKIKITKNNVDISKIGIYEVEFQIEDQWGGITQGAYSVEVVEENKPVERVLEDNLSNVITSGVMEEDAYLKVILTPSNDNPLFAQVKDQQILTSYEISIVGNYFGKIKIEFPIDSQYEGYKVYIKHLKSNGETEEFVRISKNGMVSVEVDELSPFILSIENRNQENVTPSDTSDHTVQTGDQMNRTLYVVMFALSLFSIMVVIKKGYNDLKK